MGWWLDSLQLHWRPQTHYYRRPRTQPAAREVTWSALLCVLRLMPGGEMLGCQQEGCLVICLIGWIV